MNNLVALEVNLVNNNIGNEDWIKITWRWNELNNLTWILLDLRNNNIVDVDLNEIFKDRE